MLGSTAAHLRNCNESLHKSVPLHGAEVGKWEIRVCGLVFYIPLHGPALWFEKNVAMTHLKMRLFDTFIYVVKTHL